MKIKLFVFLLITGCSPRQEEPHKDIVALRERLPAISTPLQFNSDKPIDLKAVDLDNPIIKTLTDQDGFIVFGKIFDTENYITIIGYVPDDVGTPLLITYGNSGAQLTSHALYENVMGDMGRYTSNFVTILPDRQILFTDSTITRKINKEGTDEIPGTDSLSVINKKYRISEKGLIEAVE